MEFESLLSNEEFIQMLDKNPQESDRLIEDLCRKDPDNEVHIRFAAQTIRRYRADQINVTGDEITMMWKNILQKSKMEKPVRIFRVGTVWRIAATITILLSLSIYYHEYSFNNSIRKLADEKVIVSDAARIIKSDGSEYQLNLNNSHIKYDTDGNEIVIEEKNDQTKKVANQPAENKTVLNQIVVPYGRRYSVTLSDGTVVQLNSGSKLVFPAKFPELKREVFLKGEGYFAVAKDAGKPFIVMTDFMNVKVLGTHFNISAYENEPSASTVLVEGSVEVYTNNFINNHLCKIKPGEGCFFTGTTSELKIQNVDVNEFVSWKDGFYQIKDKPLGNITKKVEKYYNKVIFFEDNELAHRLISGKLVLDDNFEKTLDFLARTTKSQFTLREDGIYVFMKKN